MGNVGIGTASPTDKLTVIGGWAYGQGGVRIGYHTLNSTNSAWLYLGNENNSVYGGRSFVTDYLWASTQILAGIFNDANDGGYYVDPDAISRTNTINADYLRSYG